MANLLEQFRDEDVRYMKAVEKSVITTLMPFRERIPALLVTLALVRCARVMLRLCNKNDQQQLVPILIAFLDGRVSPPAGVEQTTDSGLVIPPWAM